MAGAALKDEDVALADVVGRDRNGFCGVGGTTGFDDAHIPNWCPFVSYYYILLVVIMTMVAVVVVKGVSDTVNSPFDTTTEGVVVTVVVVVTHFARRTAVDYCLRLVNLKRG